MLSRMRHGGRPRARRIGLTLLGLAGLASALAPVASATIRFGANLNRRPNSPYTCGYFGFGSCSWESVEFNTQESGFPPVGRGLISRVRVRVGAFTGPR